MFHILLFIFGFSAVCANPVIESSRSAKTRIINGKPISILDAPYQVIALNVKDGEMCGGSIISTEYVLTAGHCARALPGNYLVISGTAFFATSGSPHKVIEVIQHEKYDASSIRPANDIALLKVSPAFKLDNVTEKIVELFDKNEKAKVGETGFVTGWGLTERGAESQQLRGVTVNMIDRKECDDMYEFLGGPALYQICATHPSGVRDFCNGDSGGPLVINGRQAGIVSWSGPGCALPGRPGVYTEVAAYRNWIDKHIKSKSDYSAKGIFKSIFCDWW